MPDPARYFRLPWTAADNAMTWLEPTRRCNISCDACFVTNDRHSDKSLDEIAHELDVMLRLRRCDAMLVAGGEPLVHPEIVEIVRLVRSRGIKAVVVTNGVRLEPALVHELRRAGAHGFTLHVDAHQHRPGWKGKSEPELNELRTQLADMIHAEGGLTCAFNTTIFPDTVEAVPAIVRWAVDHADRVHVLTLICVRMAHPDDPYDYYVGGRPIDFFGTTPYVSGQQLAHLTTPDLFAQVRKVLPDYDFAAYLGGTVRPESLKWVVGCHLTAGGRSFGHFGARAFELLQLANHALHGCYLAFASPRSSRAGRAALALGLFDRDVRAAGRRYLGAVLRRPALLARRLHVQAISVVQPVDVLPSGELDTCDGCPNKTFWEDRLVSACRAEEYRAFGAPVQLVPRAAPAPPPEPARAP